jgi:putative resolvase
MVRIKLSEWARRNGVRRLTAYRWIQAGRFPVPYERTPTGYIVVPVEEDSSAQLGSRTVLYARVSGSDQKADLDRQVQRLRLFASGLGLREAEVVREVGSGLHGQRKGLLSVLRDKSVKTLVVEHRDRLARFGVEYIEAALAAQGRQVVVAEAGEQTLDIEQDFVDVVRSLCARIYGRRAAKDRAKRAVEAAAAEV